MPLTFYFAPMSSASRISWVLEPLTDFPHVAAWLANVIARPAHARIQ